MAVRLKDIAQDLGVSIVSVSKALRNHPDIAKATRERILKRVKELNYRPNLAARSLVTGRSSLIGLVVPDLVHPFFADIAKWLSGALRKKDYFLIVSSSEGDPALEQAEIEQMLAHGVDAMIVASSQTDPAGLQQVRDGGTPLILLDRSVPGLNCHFVGADDAQIGVLATEHLASIGRKRIAHISGPLNNVGISRYEAYRDTLERLGLPTYERYVVRPGEGADGHGQAQGQIAMRKLLSMTPPPDAVFCFNDMVAVGAMISAQEANVRIPEDLAVVGCGNYYYDSHLRVSLTSVDQKTSELGVQIAKLIFSLLDRTGKKERIRKLTLEPTLIVRASSARTPQASVPAAKRRSARKTAPESNL